MAQDDTVTTSDESLDLPASMFRVGGIPEETTITIYRPSKDADGESGIFSEVVKFTDIGGNAFLEGDILLSTTEEARVGDRGVGITGAQFRWKNGVVPYKASPAVKQRAEAAIKHWEERTPFRFPKRTRQKDYISFEELDGCFSRVGRQGGKQVISLASGCSTGSAIHEIGHALGLWHEQSREDRDRFVKIVTENIQPQAIHNFDRHVLDGDDLGNYDFGSIMHYPATAFSKNGRPTIIVKVGNKPIGQRNGLSTGDIAAIKMMYPQLNWS